MVYEWVRRDTPREGDTVSFACNSGVAISKGTLLTLMDESRVGAHSAAAQMLAGVAAMDKKSNDYSDTISVWQSGIFEAKASGAITVGQWFQGAAQGNTISVADIEIDATSGAGVAGYALGTASADETINVRLQLA